MVVAKKNAPSTPQTPAQAQERMTRMIATGIKKSMTWKPSCKVGTAKLQFSGFCPGETWEAIVGEKFATKSSFKMPMDQFEGVFGNITASCRYDELFMTSPHVMMRYDAATNEFKCSGSYGKTFPPEKVKK